MSQSDTPLNVAIVGGGISGLAAGVALGPPRSVRGRPLAVTLFEATERLGGLLSTAPVGPLLLEEGPEAFSVVRPEAIRFCRRLGVQLVAPPSVSDGELGGCFLTPARGMSGLVAAAADALEGADVRLDAPITGISRGDGGWTLRGPQGSERFDAVVLALPAPAAATLAGGVDPELGRILGEVPSRSAASVHLVWPVGAFPEVPSLESFVVPPGPPGLVAWLTATRVADDLLDVRAVVTGPEALEATDTQLADGVSEELARWFGVTVPPLGRRISRYAHVLPALGWPASGATTPPARAGGLLRCSRAYRERIAALDARLDALPGLAIAGNVLHGAGVSNCIQAGQGAAARVLTTALS